MSSAAQALRSRRRPPVKVTRLDSICEDATARYERTHGAVEDVRAAALYLATVAAARIHGEASDADVREAEDALARMIERRRAS